MKEDENKKIAKLLAYSKTGTIRKLLREMQREQRFYKNLDDRVFSRKMRITNVD